MITINSMKDTAIDGKPVGAIINAFQQAADPLDVQLALEAYFDGLISEHAEELGTKDAEIADLTAQRDGVYQFRDALLLKLEASGGDPEKVAAVAAEALGTLEEKRRAAELAEAVELEAKAAAIRKKHEAAPEKVVKSKKS